jgi:hypothetical protein
VWARLTRAGKYGKIIVSLTVIGSPTTVFAERNPSIPLNNAATVASNFSAIISS